MPDRPEQIAANLAAAQDSLADIGIDDASGEAADAIRAALAERGDHLAEITAAMRAVAEAARAREALLIEREVAMPSDDEIQAAQKAVIASAGTGDQQTAIDRLADLLTQKRDAQKAFERGEQIAADGLDVAARDLRAPSLSAGSLAALTPLTGLLASMARMGGGTAGAGMPAEGQPVGAPTGFAPEEADPMGTLIGHIGADGEDGHGRGRHHRGGFDPSELGVGQMHTAAAAQSLPQMPTLSGAVPQADVSGRGAPPFTVSPASSGAGGFGGGGMGGGMPMMPPMGGVPGGAGGAASSKARDKTTILETDPGFTGADIESEIATSGVIGRGESPRYRTGGQRK